MLPEYGSLSYSKFHKKGIWSVHSFNGDYLSIPEDTGSCGYLFHEIPSTCWTDRYCSLKVCTLK